jgi:hypothetical protein
MSLTQKDRIVLYVCIQIFLLYLVDYLLCHSFGTEAFIATLNGLWLMFTTKE